MTVDELIGLLGRSRDRYAEVCIYTTVFGSIPITRTLDLTTSKPTKGRKKDADCFFVLISDDLDKELQT